MVVRVKDALREPVVTAVLFVLFTVRDKGTHSTQQVFIHWGDKYFHGYDAESGNTIGTLFFCSRLAHVVCSQIVTELVPGGIFFEAP